MSTTLESPDHVSTHEPAPASERQRQAAFDLLVQCASRGDGKAIGAIAVAFTPSFIEEAERLLGPHKDDAARVVQDFFLVLLEGRWPYISKPGDARPWLFRVIGVLARTRRSERERRRGTHRATPGKRKPQVRARPPWSPPVR